MKDVEHLLRDAGEQWRSDQEPPAVEMPDATQVVRRRRRAGVVVAAVIVLGLLVSGAVVAIRSDDSAPTVSTRPHRDDPPPLNAELMTRLLLPASTDDRRESEKLAAFVSAVRTSAASECLVDRGYGPWLDAGHLALLPRDSHRRYFEEPASLRHSGLTGAGAPVNLPPEASVDPQPDAPSGAISDCMRRGDEQTRPLETMKSFLMAWDQRVAMLESSPQLRPAQDAWVACMNDLGYDIRSEDEFIGGSDRVLQEAGSTEAIRATDLERGADYADCLEGGLFQARIDVRTAARVDFIADHDLMFERTLRDLPRAIRALSDRYRIEGLSALWQPANETPLATWVVGLGTSAAAAATQAQTRISECPWMTEGDLVKIWDTVSNRAFPFATVRATWDNAARSGSCTAGASQRLDVTVAVASGDDLERRLREADELEQLAPAVRPERNEDGLFEMSTVDQAAPDVVVTLTVAGTTVTSSRIRRAAEQVVERIRARGPTDPVPDT